jgi:hypothetical protein
MPDKPQGLTHGERQDVEELSAPRSPVIYEERNDQPRSYTTSGDTIYEDL